VSASNTIEMPYTSRSRPGQAMRQKSPWRVGLVGAGYVSRYHLSTLKKLRNVQIVGMADLAEDRLAEVAAQFDLAHTFRSLKEMIAATRPDVVHVLTPPSSHCSLAIEALDHGCHVFVEKPMARTAVECERMLAKAKSVGRVLSVDHSARFDPAVLKGLKAVRLGRIGDVLAIDYIRSSEYPPFAGGVLPEYYSDGGYPFRDLGVHALSVIEAFLGEIRQADCVFRSTGRHVHLTFDEWHARATCVRGSAQIYLSWNSRPMQNTIVVYGAAGRLVIDSFLETCAVERALPGGKIASLIWNATVGSLARAVGVTINGFRFATGGIGRGPDIARSITEFYTTLSAGAAPAVGGEEGKRVVSWLEKLAVPADEAKRRLVPASDYGPAEILVTGAAGFLGRRLVAALLEQGRTVRALVRRPSGAIPAHPLLRIVYGDLGQPEVVDAAVKGVEIVFHVGAATGGDASDYECGTVWGAENMVEAALRSRVKKVVHVSSLSVLDYTRLHKGARVDENTALERFPDRRGLYPKTKLQAEQIILRGVARGLNAVVLRPGQIFGPGAERVPPYGVFRIGTHWLAVGSGRMELPLAYVDDVVDALIKAGEAELEPGRILQLVDNQKISQRQYLDACSRGLGDIRVIYIPKSALYCAATVLELVGKALRRTVPLTTYRLRSLKERLLFDCGAASRELGWTPRTGIAEGLKITFGDKSARSAKELARGEQMSA
jgi:predicted dehydrogenase/nucleoside-diphosphate-sugar epimerase